ncbi:MAG: DUF131 domain-containing protein [Nitrososphaerota archaeon]|nr:DUF131 domain-containing protein [Nitrososphaerota archaeon]
MAELVIAGVFLIVAGLVFVCASSLLGARGEGGRVREGAVVMLGPVPIVFGSDARWASIAIALALALMLVYILGALR